MKKTELIKQNELLKSQVQELIFNPDSARSVLIRAGYKINKELISESPKAIFKINTSLISSSKIILTGEYLNKEEFKMFETVSYDKYYGKKYIFEGKKEGHYEFVLRREEPLDDDATMKHIIPGTFLFAVMPDEVKEDIDNLIN